ncbi:MAG: discoidin domain-containing protein [Phycisphaerae bacterium]|nr:discoidin domain-containing protein [Phycisphaerae bacterium]
MKKVFLVVLLSISAAFAFADTDSTCDDYTRTLEQRWLHSIYLRIDKDTIKSGQDAFGGIDNNRYGKLGFCTAKEKLAWWQVDMKKPGQIDRIVVCNSSSDKCRTEKFELLVSLDGKDWQTVYTHDGSEFKGGTIINQVPTEPLVIPLEGKRARYVRLQARNAALAINEVEVYPVGSPTEEDFAKMTERQSFLTRRKANMASRRPVDQSSISKYSTKSRSRDSRADKTSIPDDLLSMAIAQPEDIESALDLAGRTLEYVQQEKKLPEEAKLLKLLHGLWNSKKVSSDMYNEFYIKVRHLRRKIILSHPKLDFEKILINQVPPPKYSHNGDQNLAQHSRPGPGLTLLTDWKTSPKTDVFLKGKLPDGSVRNPDLHFAAEKVVFAFCDYTRAGQRRFFLYEAALDGSFVRQITGTKRDPFKTAGDRATVFIEDSDPAYLPDGDILFISTRCQSYGRCHGGRYNPAWVLHRCDANGESIKQISFNNENEYEPSVLNDGRLAFTRWEYTNRHEMLFHMLWSCRPDGTDVSNYYGADTITPMMVVEASAIPGTHKIVATAQGHHSYNTGTTIIIDKNKGENGEEPLTHLTPETPYSESQGWPEPHFSHPYAINEDIYLVSRAGHPVHKQGQTPPVNDRAIYLIDSLGGREFIYENPEVASFSPIAVRKRVRPPILPSMLPENAPDYGTLFVQNAYLTRNDPEGLIKPDMISAIRVNELGVQPRARRPALSATVNVELPKKVLGTVDVDEDGSAFFRVPAGVALQMQTLDKNGMALLTEMSFFYLMPGEKRSCIGCHEQPGMSPDMKILAKNARRQPVDLKPAAGPKYPGGMSFHRTVQPVLDRYCIECHGLEKSEAGVNLIGEATVFPRSLKTLVKLGDHRVGDKFYMGGGIGSQFADRNISRPMKFFAYSSKIPKMLLKNHGKVNMDHDSYMRIIEWLDLNAQATGDLFPNKIEERKLDKNKMQTLRQFVRQHLGDKLADQPDHALVNPALPEESRALMLSLSIEQGGWAEKGVYTSKEDPRFKKLSELVEDCIIRTKNENQNGWYPALECGGGEEKFIKERKRYIESLN